MAATTPIKCYSNVRLLMCPSANILQQTVSHFPETQNKNDRPSVFHTYRYPALLNSYYTRFRLSILLKTLLKDSLLSCKFFEGKLVKRSRIIHSPEKQVLQIVTQIEKNKRPKTRTLRNIRHNASSSLH